MNITREFLSTSTNITQESLTPPLRGTRFTFPFHILKCSVTFGGCECSLKPLSIKLLNYIRNLTSCKLTTHETESDNIHHLQEKIDSQEYHHVIIHIYSLYFSNDINNQQSNVLL